jgi:Integrase core domain
VHAPDLVLRDWNPTRPDRLWVADMTYVSTWQGWLYLPVIMDAYSRRIVGWSLAQHMRTELVQAALDMAVARRRPQAGLVHHTAHGSQYSSSITPLPKPKEDRCRVGTTQQGRDKCPAESWRGNDGQRARRQPLPMGRCARCREALGNGTTCWFSTRS